MVSFLTAELTDETKHHSDCDSYRRSKHHVFEQCLTRHVREQSGAPTDERSEYQADKPKADETAG